jgi:hypothetical protein
MTKIAAVWLTALLVCAPALVAQSKKKEPTVRSVTGVVRTTEDKLAVGAVVQLTDTKTKQVRSFYTQEHGDYSFRGLSPDIEYELVATFEGATSSTKTLSVYDSRKEAVIDLKLNPKK